MEKQNTDKYKVPMKFAMLNCVGSLLLGLGIADKVFGVTAVPETFQFQNYQWVLIILGILGIIPEFNHMFNYLKSKSKS